MSQEKNWMWLTYCPSRVCSLPRICLAHKSKTGVGGYRPPLKVAQRLWRQRPPRNRAFIAAQNKRSPFLWIVISQTIRLSLLLWCFQVFVRKWFSIDCDLDQVNCWAKCNIKFIGKKNVCMATLLEFRMGNNSQKSTFWGTGIFLRRAAWSRLCSSLPLFSRVSDIPDAAAIIMIIIIVMIFSRTEAAVLKLPCDWAAATLHWERPDSKYWIGTPNTNPLQTHGTKTRLDSLPRNTLIKYPPARVCVCVYVLL